jgi:prepilin-type N-terminal cleavage/methylation domain-containing protein
MSNGNRAIRSDAGFTLLEVLIALSILGGGMFMLLESHYGTLSLFSDTHDAAQMELLAQQGTALAEVEILSGEESGDGDFGDLFPDYSYAYRTQFLDEVETPGLMLVNFEIYGPDETREFRFRVYDGVQIDETK